MTAPASTHTTEKELAVSRALLHGLIAVRASGVNYSFGSADTRTQVLFDNAIEISRGEIVILTGPSGSGKTTLLTLIGTLRRMQEGSLQVLGTELAGMDRLRQMRLRRNVGFIFQHHNLFSSLTGLENVRMATGLLESVTSAEATRRCAAMLETLGLAERMNYLPAGLSGGQRQRVAIARALVNEPELVLADEPTAALDAASGETVMGLLRRMADGPNLSTVLIVTHDQRLLDRADRIVNMVNGRIVSNVRPKEMVRILKMLGQVKDLEGLSDLTMTRIAERVRIERRQPGDTLVREGSEGDRLYVIGEGTAEAYSDGKPIREVRAREPFGVITAVSHRHIPETVRARTPLELYVLRGDDLTQVMAADKGLEERVQLLLMSRQAT
jgi:putative ABC transport system ATP-binding protein